MAAESIDLGHNHWLRFTGLLDAPKGLKGGAIIDHLAPNGVPCSGSVTFRIPETDPPRFTVPRWDVLSWDPLTLDPSVLCRCGDHGWIRNGRWEPA